MVVKLQNIKDKSKEKNQEVILEENRQVTKE